jgi:hypothetical protein
MKSTLQSVCWKHTHVTSLVIKENPDLNLRRNGSRLMLYIAWLASDDDEKRQNKWTFDPFLEPDNWLRKHCTAYSEQQIEWLLLRFTGMRPPLLLSLSIFLSTMSQLRQQTIRETLIWILTQQGSKNKNHLISCQRLIFDELRSELKWQIISQETYCRVIFFSAVVIFTK